MAVCEAGAGVDSTGALVSAVAVSAGVCASMDAASASRRLGLWSDMELTC